MEVEKEQVITAVKGLTRRVNIKQEHLEIIDRALEYNNYSQEEWEEIVSVQRVMQLKRLNPHLCQCDLK